MIEDILEKIEQGLKANCPDVFASLRPPACPEMLRKFEQTCLAGGKMPEWGAYAVAARGRGSHLRLISP